MRKEDAYFEAMKARDHRFDGKFFVGVKTTGIYCRPICPAKPKRENIEFFQNHLEAERAGYRPCLRCRPESAPLSQAWMGTSAVVQRAIKVLHSQETIDFSENEFAHRFGVTARHLRRLFIQEVGKTPKQISFENRLNLARKLIVETTLPFSEIAFAAGFSSVRRFNDAFKERFKKPPREIRRNKTSAQTGLRISLPYRPPFDFEGLLKAYENHRVGDLEWFQDGKMHRLIFFNQQSGWISIENHAATSSLVVEIHFPDSSHIHTIISKVRQMFDLDSDPLMIANSFRVDPNLRKLLKLHPGIRIPSGWDPFEIAISTLLGQLVSVERGRALVNDLIRLAGEIITTSDGRRIHLFPTPAQVAKADLTKLGTTGRRKQTLIDFSKALMTGEISLEPTQDVATFLEKVQTIKGIGPWSADYMALRILRDTDSFPAKDLILARAVAIHGAESFDAVRPWRGYAAVLLWRSLVYSKAPKEK